MAASGYELNLNLDFSKALQQAAQFEQKLKDLTTQATTLETALSKAGNALSGSNADVLNRIKSALEQIGNKTAINIDTSKVNEVYTALDKVVETMRILTDPNKQKVQLFDTQGLYATSKALVDINKEYKDIEKQIKEIIKTGKPSSFTEPINPRTNKAYGRDTTTYKKALALQRDQELMGLIEKQAILDKELKYAKMTQDQKAEYLRKTLQKMLAEERKFANGVRKEYSTTTKELVSVLKQSEKLGKQNVGGVHDDKIRQLEARYIELNNKRIAMEQQYGNVVVDVARNTQRQVWDIEAKRIQDKQKAEQAYQVALWDKLLSSPKGALDLAKDAKTMGDMKEAQAYLKKALDNVNVTDTATIKKLNDEYTRLRATIEKLTATTKNEQTLQPTLANEYKRLLTELDKVRDAKKRLEETSSYKSKDAKAMSAMDDLVARETDVQNRILQIRQNAQGKLDEVDRKHNAQRTTESIAEFERAERRKDEIIRQGVRKRSKYGTVTTDSASKLIGVADNVKNVAQAERAMNAMREAIRHLDKDSANYQQTVDKLKNKIKELEKFTQSATRTTTQTVTMNDRQAMAFSRSAKSIDEQNRAIKALKVARDNLNRGDFSSQSAYIKRVSELTKEIQRQTTAVNNLTNKQQSLGQSKMSLMNTAAQLQRQLAMVFSVSAIKGYINKLIAVRGEFELQQKALSAILMSKDQADKLWNQTVKLAVKSPFTIKELSGYTKQLAAYRIETNKLHETTKRLADVSAGLGVDMQRIILAYGQVRAASYLRGTELRQFTEAGIPMLEELAKHFSELEGRAISVGDVFSMISKRLVSFKDVATVFERMTNEGGVFYEMQEKQSESLKGMVSNLKDRISIMLNDIGIANEGALKGMVEVAQNFVANWREIWVEIRNVAIAFAAYKIACFGATIATKEFGAAMIFTTPRLRAWAVGVKLSIAMNNALAASTKGVRRVLMGLGNVVKLTGVALAGLGRAFLSMLPFAVLAGIYELIMRLTAASRAAKELHEELERIDAGLSGELEESIGNYKVLATTIRDVTKSYNERQKALETLKRTFGEILPSQMLELDYVLQLDDAYTDATTALEKYYETKSREQKFAKIDESFESELSKDINELWIDFKSLKYDAENGLKYNIMETYNMDERHVKQVINKLVDDVKKGTIDISNIEAEFIQRLNKMFNIDIDIDKFRIGANYYNHEIKDLTETLTRYRTEVDAVVGMDYDTIEGEKHAKEVEKQSKKYAELTESLSALSAAYSNYYNALQANKYKAELTDDDIRKVNQYREDIYSVYKSLELPMPKWSFFSQITASVFDIEQEVERVSTIINNKFVGGLSKSISDGNTELQKLANNINNIIKSFDGTNLQQVTERLYRELSAQYNVPLSAFDKLKVDGSTSITDLRKNIENEIKAIEESIKAFDTALANQPLALKPDVALSEVEKAQGFTKEQIEEMRTLTVVLTATLNALGGATKDNKNKGENIWEKRISIIKELRKEYDDLNKTFDKNTSKQKILEGYADAANGVFKGLGISIGEIPFDDLGKLTEFVDKLMDKTAKDSNDYIKLGKLKGSLEVEIETDKVKEKQENLIKGLEEDFDKYELGLELEKLNLPKNFIKDFFDVDVLSLEDLRKKVENFDTTGFGKDALKDHQKLVDKINEMDEKAQAKRLKTYLQYARESVGERAKIKLEELKKLQEIERTFKPLDTDTEEVKKQKQQAKAIATQKVKEESEQATKKLEWEEFQKSDMFLMIFEDLESASGTLIESTLEKLKDFKKQWADMPLESVRAMTDKINQLESALLKLKNPFKAVGEIDKSIEKILGGQTREQINQKALESQQKIDQNNVVIGQLETIRELMFEGKDLTQEQRDIYTQTTGSISENVETLNEEIKNRKNDNKELDKSVSRARQLTKAEKDKINAYNAQADAYNNINKMANDLYNASKELVELFAGDDSIGVVFADMGMSMANSVLNTLALQAQLKAAKESAQGFGAAMNTAMGVIGWIVMAIQLVSQAVSAVIKAHDNGKQKEIDKEAEAVKRLEKEYKKLEKGIEDAYSLTTLKAANELAEQNLKMQRNHYREMQRLEEEKKKSDKEKIKDYQDSIDEIGEQIDQLQSDRVSEVTAGILDSAKDAARDFVDACLDAFNETGDGLSGLKDSFKEITLDMVKQQASLLIAGTYLDRWKYMLSQYITPDDLELTSQEAAKWIDEVQKELPKLNEQLETYFRAMEQAGVDLDGTGEQLSGLQKGIQGITEAQADIIAAYLNSIRFYVADSNVKLNQLLAMQTNEDIPNPMLSQLKIIASQTTAINTLLGSVTKSGHSAGGRGIKVFIS